MTINPEIAEASAEIGRRLCDRQPTGNFDLELLVEARQYVVIPQSVQTLVCRRCDAKYFKTQSGRFLDPNTFEETELCECLFTEG